jgi:hypothetical protein
MPELLVTFTVPTRSSSGDLYWARAFGGVADDGLWEGWLEFTRGGDDIVVHTSRETEQPNRDDLVYWAQGLSDTYLEGALVRALRPAPEPAKGKTHLAPKPRRSRPPGVARKAILDPFQTFAEGEDLLRSQLNALSRDHLVSIIEVYGFVGPAGGHEWTRKTPESELANRIVEAVRARSGSAARPEADSADAPEAR